MPTDRFQIPLKVLEKQANLENATTTKLQTLKPELFSGMYDADSPLYENNGLPTARLGDTQGAYANAPELKQAGELNSAGVNERIRTDNFLMGVGSDTVDANLDPQYYNQYANAMNPALVEEAGKGNILLQGDPTQTGRYGRQILDMTRDGQSLNEDLQQRVGRKDVGGRLSIPESIINTDVDGRVAEDIDIAQSGMYQWWGKSNKAVGKIARSVAETLGANEATAEEWFPTEAKSGLFGGTFVDMAKTEFADALAGVNPKTREDFNRANQEAIQAITDKKYGSAVWDIVTNIDRHLSVSAAETLSLASLPTGLLTLAGRTSEQAEEYEKNNGKEPSAGWILGSLLTDAGLLYGERLIIGKGIKDVVSGTGAVKAVTTSTGKEALQESGETIKEEAFTQKGAFTDEADQTIGEIATSPETQFGAMTGAASAGALSTAGQVASTAKGKLPDSEARTKLKEKIKKATKNTKRQGEVNVKGRSMSDEEVADVTAQAKEVYTNVSEGKYKTPSEIVKALDDLEVQVSDTSREDVISGVENIRKYAYNKMISDGVKEEDLTLGSEAEAVSMLEDIVLYSDPGTNQDVAIDIIAKKYGIESDKVEGIKAIAKEGDAGYKKLGNLLTRLNQNPVENKDKIDRVIAGLSTLEESHIFNKQTIESAIDEITAKSKSGVQPDATVDVNLASGKKYSIDVKDGEITTNVAKDLANMDKAIAGIQAQYTKVNLDDIAQKEQEAKVDEAVRKSESYKGSVQEQVDNSWSSTIDSVDGQTTKISDIVEVNKNSKSKLTTDGVDSMLPKMRQYANQASKKLGDILLPITSAEKYKQKESPARGMIYDVDGKVNKNVATAIAMAVSELQSYGMEGLVPKTKADIARILGKQEHEVSDTELSEFSKLGMNKTLVADQLGSTIASNLGIKANKKVDAELYDRLVADLGQTAIIYGAETGVLNMQEISAEQYSKIVGEESGIKGNIGFVKPSTSYDKLSPKAKIDYIVKERQKYEELAKELGVENDAIATYNTEPSKSKPKYKARNNPIADVPKAAVKVLNKLSKMKHSKVQGSVDWIKSNKKLAIKLLGYKSAEEMKYSSKEKQDSQKAKNEAILKILGELMASDGTNEMYFDWYYSKNGRYFIDSTTVNPQTDKLHRFIVIPDSHNVTLDKSKDMDKFYYAVAQATGFAVDKKSTKEILAHGKKMVDMGSSKLEAELHKPDAEVEHLSHYLQAVEAVKSYENSKGGTFETNLTAEFDALTSGFGIKLMQYPILENMVKWLDKVGVYTTKSIDGGMNDEIASKGFNDSYQELASQIERGKVKPKYDTYGIWPSMSKTLPEATKGVKVEPKLRSLFKQPFMTFNYAAGMKSIRKALSNEIVSEIVDGIATGKPEYKDLFNQLAKVVPNLQDQIRTKELQNINVGKSNLHKVLNDMVFYTYGAQVQTIMESEFSEFVKANKTVNKAFEAMFAEYKKDYDKAIKEHEGILNAEAKLSIINSLKNKFPMIKGPLSEGYEDGIAIYSTGRQDPKSRKYKAAKTQWVKDGKPQQTTIQQQVREFEKAISAGAVIPIHYIDGAVMNKVAEGHEAQMIHDAIMPNLLDMDKAVQDYNEAWYKTNRDYSVVDEIVASAERIGIDTKDLKELQAKVRKGREDLYSKDVSIGHMVGMPNSTYSSKEDVVLGSEPLGGTNIENERAYNDHKKKIDKEYKRLSAMVGQMDPVNNQTIKAVNMKGQRIVVSYQKGPDRTVDNTNLGSETGKLGKRMQDLKDNALRSIEGIVDIGQELHEMDTTNTKEHKEYLMKLLGSIDMDFMREMNLYWRKDAAKNRGMVDTSDMVIETSENDITANNEMSGLEVYSHEMRHAYTKFAVAMASNDSSTYKVVRQIKALRSKVKKEMTWQDLLPEQSIDKVREESIAKARYEYIFNSDNSLHEFIAFGTTNKAMMDRMAKIEMTDKAEGKNLWERLKLLANNLLDIILGNMNFKSLNKNTKQQLMELHLDLAGFNNKTVEHIRKEKSAVDKILNGIEVSNEYLAEKMEVLHDKLKSTDIELPPRNGSKVQYAKWMARNYSNMMFNEDWAKYRAQALSAFGMKPEGLVQNVGRDMTTNVDSLERILEQMIMDSRKVDRARENTETSTKSVMMEKFKTKPTKTEEESITTVMLDTDMSSVYGKYTLEELMNPDKAIGKVKAELKEMDPENYNWNSTQATGLGFYMATHTAGRAQLLNASNIANKVLTDSRREASPELIAKIDELATLSGLKYTPTEAKEVFSEVAKSNPEAIQHIADTMEGYKKLSRKNLFSTDVNMIKGYSKELFDPDINIAIRPLSMKDDMEFEGYKLVETLDKDSSDTSKQKMAIYKNSTFGLNSYNKGAMRVTSMHKRGTSLKDIAKTQEGKLAYRIAENDRKDNIKRLNRDIKAMEDGTYKVEESEGMNTVLDDSGNVVDFRYMMSKRKKKDLLKQDTTASEVLGRTVASLQDKIDTDIQNKATLDVIITDMEENYVEDEITGLNGAEYIKISPKSHKKKVKDIYAILPTNVKMSIKESEKGYIAVRRDMLHNYFGFRDASITDAWLLDVWTPDVIKRGVRMAEAMWKEVVSISKVDVVIRMPMVFLSNVMSNFMYSVTYGPTNPLKVFDKQREAFRNLKEYIDVEHRIGKLEAEKLAGKNVGNEISMLKNEQKGNPVHELMDAGMYSAIIEDIDLKNKRSSNRLSQAIEDKTEGMPEFVKQGAHWLYLDDRTSYFRTVTQATQMSDFIARVTQYELMVEKGVKKDEAKLHVLDTFINYDKPASSVEEYLNNMGAIMFTKYAKRIQRVISKDLKTRPLNVFLAVLGQEVFYDVSDVYEQSMFTKSWTNIGIDPWEHIKRASTPTALQFVGLAD